MKTSFQDLILKTIEKLTNLRIGFGKTRLIKIAYLTEIEHYRNTGERLTDADWVYYKYGPYVYSFDEILKNKKIDVEDSDIENFSKISINQYANINTLSRDVDIILDKIIYKFAKLPLNDLLQYVYYDTEPMIDLENRGEKLDFSLIQRKEFYSIKQYKVPKNLTKNLTKKYKERIKNVGI